ncbi:phage replisome organizer N-terminal domain-containing protein [Clostridium beijerinckii]|uniref:Phage replisome organizer n=1 Tax=Clostridium beijerinckii TaxID=1520 RepID=A0AAW3W2Q4_CLOBE|nr:phage replisome organizer N-terminal domain-containing protein [Clostridium beijerinckii]MBC2455719.1 phage replisome organizer [Clostridium beijerinckii]MBC2473196.1 phage replisome organizer [Clostridium beijerinckii]NOV62295.1 putative phage replisome organizer [Clostridium beijerinckii]NOV68208.1 putative phage replisome organizer [Clostridium beijerinckii]NOW30347.1 putative phage replisome organizer [Clostridium beijerinckii]
MKERKFVKLRVDMYDDTKSKIIDTMNERDLIQYIWIRLIVLAGKVNLEGELFLSRNIPYTMETIAIEFNRDIERVKLAMKVLMDLEMIEFTEDKIYKVKNFVKHQNIKINKSTEIKANVVKENDSSHKRDESKIKDRENIIGVDSKSNGYKSIDQIVRNKTAKIEDKSIMNANEEINENNNDDNNINNCNRYNKDSTSVDSEFVVKGNTENESFANSNKNNSNIIIAERTQNSDTINASIDSTNNKDNNENIDYIDNTRNADVIDSNSIYDNNDANMNISLETEKNSCENNAQSSIPIYVKKKNSKGRKKSNNKSDINEINLSDDDEEIVELCSGDVTLGKDEKVVMAFTM